MFAKPKEQVDGWLTHAQFNCDGPYSTHFRGDHGFHLGIKVEGLAFVGALARSYPLQCCGVASCSSWRCWERVFKTGCMNGTKS